MWLVGSKPIRPNVIMPITSFLFILCHCKLLTESTSIFAPMTSRAACYDVIYHPSTLKMWGVDRHIMLMNHTMVSIKHGLLTADHRLGIRHRLGIKWALRTMLVIAQNVSLVINTPRNSWWSCATRFSKSWAWPKCYFLHPFLDLVSVSNIHDKCNVCVYTGVNHVIIA